MRLAAPGIITLSSIVRHLANHRDALGPLEHCTMRRYLSHRAVADGVPNTVVAVPDTATVREALEATMRHGGSGVPVIDGTGAVVANVSGSDVGALALLGVRASAEDAERLLAANVVAFLTERRSASPATTPFVVHSADTFGTAITQLAESGLHHLYIVDEARRPIGVLSLSDVISTVALYLPPPA